MRLPSLALLAVTALGALAASGCNLYFTGDDSGDDVCKGGIYEALPEWDLRNPQTGECQYFGGGGGCGPCGPCAADDVAYKTPAQAIPDWGECYGACSGLGEAECLAAPACLGAYDGGSATPTFLSCAAIAPSGPITGACDGLDAQTCSEHNDCIMVYISGIASTEFNRCAPEPNAHACGDVDCGSGAHCEQACSADGTCGPTCAPDDLCGAVDCAPGYVCAATCSTSNSTVTCAASCQPMGGACVTLPDEASCVARTDCEPVYIGDNCTCTPAGCTCETQTWERCQDSGPL